MIDLEDLYFEWLMTRLDPDGVREGVGHVSALLHRCPFQRRVGNDINRAIEGANLRVEFLSDFEDANFDPYVTNDLMMQECSWLEMLIALARTLDYMYDGGVEERFLEMVENLGLDHLLIFNPDRTDASDQRDQREVDIATNDFDHNRFTRDGHGGIFPLYKPDHPDQREVEIWDQHAAYFRERLEGVLWTSTS